MIRTCSVQMQDDLSGRRFRRACSAFTMTELVVVIVIVSMFVLMVQINLLAVFRKSTFKSQAEDLVSTLQMAARAAAQSDKRYEVIIDFTEQNYILREITTPDLAQVLDEEIIVNNDFSGNCRAAYVLFDDGDYANEGRAKFRAGHSGWQYGGRIVLLDSNEKPYSVVINRLNNIVELKEGEVELLTSKDKDEMLF